MRQFNHYTKNKTNQIVEYEYDWHNSFIGTCKSKKNAPSMSIIIAMACVDYNMAVLRVGRRVKPNLQG